MKIQVIQCKKCIEELRAPAVCTRVAGNPHDPRQRITVRSGEDLLKFFQGDRGEAAGFEKCQCCIPLGFGRDPGLQEFQYFFCGLITGEVSLVSRQRSAEE